jgi:hypothetical protein
MQNSSRWDSNVVYPRQHLPGLEEEWLPIMGAWKSYASQALSTIVPINSFLDFVAGAGKSIMWYAVSLCSCDREFMILISSAIIEDIKNTQKARPALIAYYYFDFKDAYKRDLRGLLASLLFQLSENSDPCRDVLYNLYTSGSEEPSDAALAGCLKRMMELPRQLPTFLVVDALDECPNTTGTPSAREEVLDFLGNLVGSSHSNLFICVTSRPEQDIQTALNRLNPLTSAFRQVSLHEEGGQREDIKRYVHSFVHEDGAMRKWREEDRNLVVTTLVERAGGM